MDVSSFVKTVTADSVWVSLVGPHYDGRVRLSLTEALNMAEELKSAVTRAKLSDPRVKRLATELRNLHAEPSFEHMALALIQHGYHDRTDCGC